GDSVDRLRGTTGVHDLLVHPPKLVVGQLFEFAAIESRKVVDAIARDVGDQSSPSAIERRMTDRQEEQLRLEPAAGVHGRIVGTARRAVDDESVHLAELFT